MISLIELSEQLKGLANDLTGQEQANLMLMLGTDALAMVKRRVQETGVNPEGQKYTSKTGTPYSTKTMLVGNSSFVQKDKANIFFKSKPQWRKVGIGTDSMRSLALLEGGYEKLRDLQTRQIGFVDFTFTGRMLGNAKVKGDVKVISDQQELNSGVVRIAATQELEKKKLSGLTERKGEILALSKKEETQLTGYYNIWVEKLLKKNGLK
jgi:hypothetical protein